MVASRTVVAKQRRQAETLNCITKVIVEWRDAVQETHRG
jgi:hypothetical protein